MTSMQKYEADYNFAKYAAIRNLALVRKSKVCGCVRCGNIFLAERSMFFDFRFVEGPVCCPHCLCESVIPDAAGQPINPETLARLAHALRIKLLQNHKKRSHCHHNRKRSNINGGSSIFTVIASRFQSPCHIPVHPAGRGRITQPLRRPAQFFPQHERGGDQCSQKSIQQ